MKVEEVMSMGEQVLRIFTRQNKEMVETFRNDGVYVTEFIGHGRDGEVSMLLFQTPRKQSQILFERARKIDPKCFCIIDDVRMSTAERKAKGIF